jgi:hypothetical protein
LLVAADGEEVLTRGDEMEAGEQHTLSNVCRVRKQRVASGTNVSQKNVLFFVAANIRGTGTYLRSSVINATFMI